MEVYIIRVKRFECSCFWGVGYGGGGYEVIG